MTGMPFLDRVADLTVAGDAAFGDLRALYTSDERLRVPDESSILQATPRRDPVAGGYL